MRITDVIKQKSYEHIVHVVRRHPVTFIPRFLFTFLLLFVPFIVYRLIGSLFPFLFSDQNTFALAILSTTIYLLAIYLFFYTEFVDYFLDMWIVTNDRIIDIEQQGVFSRTIVELDLFQIQDVKATVSGVFPTLFHYGDIHVTTASSTNDIIFRRVPSPANLARELITLSHEDRKFHIMEPGHKSTNNILDTYAPQ